MEQILLNGISVSELLKEMEQLLERKLDAREKAQNNIPKYLTRKEASVLLKISLPTLNEWTKEGLLISYQIDNRILYKANEVDGALRKRNFG
jgi:excisionase family DNA binding protein